MLRAEHRAQQCVSVLQLGMTRGEGPLQPPASQGSFGLCIIDEWTE